MEAVERLAGLQAQEPRPPFLGLWTRVEGFAREDLHRALRERRAVRGLLLRATLHLVAACDFAAVRAALQPVMSAAMKGALRGRDEGLDLDAVLPAARDLLAGEPRTFAELRALLSERFPGVDDRALGYSVRTHLPLVMVPTEDRWAFPRDARFALAEEELGGPLCADATPHDLVRRHLAAFGPASAADVQTWCGLPGLRAVLDEQRDGLEVFADERGRELFDLPDAPRPDADVPAPPRLLPEFDNLVLAHDDRTRLLADEHRPAVVTRNLRVRATFLVDGEVAGTWRAERKGRKAALTLTPFHTVPRRATGELTAEAERLLRFAEEDASSFDVRVDDPA